MLVNVSLWIAGITRKARERTVFVYLTLKSFTKHAKINKINWTTRWINVCNCYKFLLLLLLVRWPPVLSIWNTGHFCPSFVMKLRHRNGRYFIYARNTWLNRLLMLLLFQRECFQNYSKWSNFTPQSTDRCEEFS